MKKRFLFVGAMAALALCAETAFAQTAADFTYELNVSNDGVIITGYKGTATRVTIPADIEGFPVKEIGPYVFSAGRINPGDVINILNYDVKGTVTTGAYTVNLHKLRSMASEDVTYKITSVVIPEGVTKIGDYAFAEVSVQPIQRDEGTKVTVIHSLSSVTLPNTLTEIGEYAFTGCEKLAALTLPPSLAALGRDSFSGCKSLKTVTIPEGVTVLPRAAFYGCVALSSVTLPQSLTTIERSAFSTCSSLAAIVIPDGVTSIGRSPFIDSGLTTITWPAKIPVIPVLVFSGSKLKTIVIPEGVTDISQEAFRDCKDLTSVTLPSTIKNIDAWAFLNCSALTTITIPDSVTALTFYEDYGNESTVRWVAVTDTNNGAFMGCGFGLAVQAKLKKLGYTGAFK
ncbi:hypothetical protein AGMMS50255_1480 [Spirochaetia bacterium]|nr:hypothetical protein AGMMS50255_1480 [Spirochaetia bacterium]